MTLNNCQDGIKKKISNVNLKTKSEKSNDSNIQGFYKKNIDPFEFHILFSL